MDRQLEQATFGGLLRRYRCTANMTQEELGFARADMSLACCSAIAFGAHADLVIILGVRMTRGDGLRRAW